MISQTYITRHLKALVALIRKEESWESRLDLTEQGVWNSVWALIFSIPLVIGNYLAVIELQQFLTEMTEIEIVLLPPIIGTLAQIIAFITVWLVELTIFIGVAKRLHKTEKLAALIITYHWSILFFQMISFLIVYFILAVKQYELLFIFLMLNFALYIHIRWQMLKRLLGLKAATIIAIIITLFIASNVVEFFVLIVTRAIFTSASAGAL